MEATLLPKTTNPPLEPPKDPLSAARERGKQMKKKLLYNQDNPLTNQEVAKKLGITTEAINDKRIQGELLGLYHEGKYLYPSWQFNVPGLKQVLAALQEFDSWTKLMFLRTGDIRLGKTPLESLQASDIELTVKAAKCYGKHGAA
ncbi:MAG: hypothetical protein GDA44_05080 [Prochloron sp. SP5CPC1]|nr:hypothetical protein [Candidatus Paraprochloron terpiosi SP5CPC1]